MLERLLELEDIRLLPHSINSGYLNKDKFNFGIYDEVDHTTSLPIFAHSELISKDNCNEFNKVGIRPILPIDEDLNIRLEGCEYIFTPFTIQEIRNEFLNKRRSGNNVFRIFIYNNGNGHSTEVLNTAVGLRKTYGPQVNIASGNIANAKTYEEYCKAGINYAFVGMGESVNDINGFYYPIASLLIELCGKRNVTALRNTKVVANGSIYKQADILKALALGADYVVLGEPLAKVIEAKGQIYKVEKGSQYNRIEVNKGSLLGLSKEDLASMSLKRFYSEELTGEVREVKVTSNLEGWMKELYKIMTYGFVMSDALTWKTFHENIRYGKI